MKPKAGNLRHNAGAKGVLLHLGVGAGKSITVREVKGGRLSGQAAASFYATFRSDLEKVHTGKRKFAVLEDNDPTGYTSKRQGRESSSCYYHP